MSTTPSPKTVHVTIDHVTFKSTKFDGFELTRVWMPAGRELRIPAAENDRSIGVYCCKGGTRHGNLDAPDVHLPQAGEGFLANDRRTGWSNAHKGSNDLHLYAPVDTEWVCIAELDGSRPAVTAVNVDGDTYLPANVRVLVLDGTVTIGTQTLAADACFPPSPSVRLASGRGLVLLVK